MNRYFLSLGSNINPSLNLPACLTHLKKTFRVTRISSLYETDPVGPCGAEKFWNAAVEILTDMEPSRIREELKRIETALGRIRQSGDKFFPRTIDLDLILELQEREEAFVAVPLAEIAPDKNKSMTGKSQNGCRKITKPIPGWTAVKS